MKKTKPVLSIQERWDEARKEILDKFIAWRNAYDEYWKFYNEHINDPSPSNFAIEKRCGDAEGTYRDNYEEEERKEFASNHRTINRLKKKLIEAQRSQIEAQEKWEKIDRELAEQQVS